MKLACICVQLSQPAALVVVSDVEDLSWPEETSSFWHQNCSLSVKGSW